MNAARAVALAAVALAACFQPIYPSGIPCSAEGTCPPEQMCERTTNTCRFGAADASIVVDAPPVVVPDAMDAVMPPDAMPACTLYPQGGCTGTEKCTVSSADQTTATCTTAGTVALGAACAGFGTADNCVAGGMCVFGECLALCTASPDSCGGSAICVPFGPNSTTVESLCLPRCDVLAPSCQPIGGMAANCYLGAVDSGECALSSGNLALGQACTATNACVSGAGCYGATTSSLFCRAYCNFTMYPNTQAPQCTTGQTCHQIRDTYGDCE